MDSVQSNEEEQKDQDLNSKMFDKWYTLKSQGDLKSKLLLRLGSLEDAFSVTTYFDGYIYPPLSLLYLVLIVGIIVIVNKNRLMSFVHVIIITSTLLYLMSQMLTIPIFLTFYHFANFNAPLPYPLCLVFILFKEYVPKIVFMISLYLKVLLAANRFCSVFYPLKLQYLFSKSKCRQYCMMVSLSILVFECLLNFYGFPVVKSICIDDLWNSGNTEVYYACSLSNLAIDVTTTSTSSIPYMNIVILELLLFGVGSAIFSILNIAFLIKMHRLKSRENNDLNGINDINDSRLMLLNKVYMWVVLATVVIDIPHHAMVCFIASNILSGVTGSRDVFKDDAEHLVQRCVGILFKIVIPFDLFILTLISKKIRSAIRRSFCKTF